MYKLHTRFNSPNHGGITVPLPCKTIVLHWWGTPLKQNPYGVISWLCNPHSQVSAHAVIWPNNVACIVNYDCRSWANGNDWANNNTITLELDPNNIPETITTTIEYIKDLIKQGVVDHHVTIKGHCDYYHTQCPGDYYHHIPYIQSQVRKK